MIADCLHTVFDYLALLWLHNEVCIPKANFQNPVICKVARLLFKPRQNKSEHKSLFLHDSFSAVFSVDILSFIKVVKNW